MENVLTIRQLNQKLKEVLDHKFPFIWVKGEVTNLARPSSGHVYFSLKDGDDVLNCVWFRNNQEAQSFDPLTGEVWEDGPKPSIVHSLRDGQELICAGRLTIYAPRGQYQLVVELAQETGVGQLYANFEALKKKLSAEGLFDSKYKKPLPTKIRNVALITAKTGAVIQDFIRISNGRGVGARIHLYPSLVQGDSAPQMLINALLRAQKDTFESSKIHAHFTEKKISKTCSQSFLKTEQNDSCTKQTPYNTQNNTTEQNTTVEGDKGDNKIADVADVIVFIRGGGSIQDLWAFNDEQLARAIHACPIPVITGIGHEPDFTIADYVADMSMATPSHVAQILWQDRAVIMQQIDDKERELTELMESILYHFENTLQNEIKKLHILSPVNKVMQKTEIIENFSTRLLNGMSRNISFEELKAKSIIQRLTNQRPQYIHEKNTLFRLQKSLHKNLLLALNEKQNTFEHVNARFITQIKNFTQTQKQSLERLSMQLEIHSPLAPLEKGYVLVESQKKTGDKQVLRSTYEIKVNDTLYLNFKDGQVKTQVASVSQNEYSPIKN